MKTFIIMKSVILSVQIHMDENFKDDLIAY